MAYIHKISLYVVDGGEVYSNGKGLIEDLFSVSDDTYPIEKTIESETRSFDWDDDVVVNKVACTKEEAEGFFNALS